jgi:succinyl-CoA synthetase beta subunit
MTTSQKFQHENDHSILGESMNVHEYQAKELMRKFGIKVLNGHVAKTADEAVEAAKKLGGNIWVVKAQIHAGGR